MCDAAVCCGLIENALGRRLVGPSCGLVTPVMNNSGLVSMDDESLWVTKAASVV